MAIAKAKEELESFDGQIYKKELKKDDKYIVTHTAEQIPSATYVIDKESADMTSHELQKTLSLPQTNQANVQTEITIIEPHTAFTGKAADKSSEIWAHDHATGGGNQTVINPNLTNKTEIFK